MKRQLLILALFLMIVASLFSGLVIKEWIFIYEFELELYDPLVQNGKYLYAVVKILLTICHLIIFLLPFLISNKYFKLLLIIIPVFFVLLFSIISGLIFFLLIPFIVFWFTALYQERKLTNKIVR